MSDLSLKEKICDLSLKERKRNGQLIKAMAYELMIGDKVRLTGPETYGIAYVPRPDTNTIGGRLRVDLDKLLCVPALFIAANHLIFPDDE